MFRNTNVVVLALLLTTATVSAQDFYFVSSRDSNPGELNFEIYRYQNGTEARITTTPVIEEHPIFSSTPSRSSPGVTSTPSSRPPASGAPI